MLTNLECTIQNTVNVFNQDEPGCTFADAVSSSRNVFFVMNFRV